MSKRTKKVKAVIDDKRLGGYYIVGDWVFDEKDDGNIEDIIHSIESWKAWLKYVKKKQKTNG